MDGMNLIYNKETGEWEEYKEPFTTIDVATEEAFEELMETIEKQKKKKPNGEYCPNCKRHLRKPKITSGYTGKVKKRNGDNYCPTCGQAIDWSEQAEREKERETE